MAAVRDIYAHYVLHSLATFEETPPTLEEMVQRWRQRLDMLGLPYLVAEGDRKASLGYAYAAIVPRPRRISFIDRGFGLCRGRTRRPGHRLCAARRVDRACERGPWRQMVAIVGDSGNLSSIALHRRFGFELTGTLRAVGFKFGRWVDTPILQRALAPMPGVRQ